LESRVINENRQTLYRHQGDEHDYSNVYSYDWPPFYTAMISVPGNLDPRDFGTITRSDGTLQTTYKHWPLYLYRNKGPGDISGHGVNNMWAVSPDVNPL
jgi:predicted lipoprotein with Yx(FWY)xxD motif